MGMMDFPDRGKGYTNKSLIEVSIFAVSVVVLPKGMSGASMVHELVRVIETTIGSEAVAASADVPASELTSCLQQG